LTSARRSLASSNGRKKIIYANIPEIRGKVEKPKLREIVLKPAKEAMEKEFKNPETGLPLPSPPQGEGKGGGTVEPFYQRPI